MVIVGDCSFGGLACAGGRWWAVIVVLGYGDGVRSCLFLQVCQEYPKDRSSLGYSWLFGSLVYCY